MLDPGIPARVSVSTEPLRQDERLALQSDLAQSGISPSMLAIIPPSGHFFQLLRAYHRNEVLLGVTSLMKLFDPSCRSSNCWEKATTSDGTQASTTTPSGRIARRWRPLSSTPSRAAACTTPCTSVELTTTYAPPCLWYGTVCWRPTTASERSIAVDTQQWTTSFPCTSGFGGISGITQKPVGRCTSAGGR